MHALRWGFVLALAASFIGSARLYAQDSTQVAVPPSETPQVADAPPATVPDSAVVEMLRLYGYGVQAIQANNFREALDTLEQFSVRYQTSAYTPEVLYWRAFALYRIGGDAELRKGLETLQTLGVRHPAEFTRVDGPALEQRILGALARRGDPVATQLLNAADETTAADTMATGSGTADAEAAGNDASCTVSDSSGPMNDVKISALNALAQMNAERAGALLQELLRRRDSGSYCLRHAAILLLGRLRTAGAEMSLLDAARSDPNLAIRRRAVLFLSQFNTEHAIGALDSIVRTGTEEPLVEQALMALAQSDNPRAHESLRAYAARTDLPSQKRSFAIRWLVARPSAENASFLRALYTGLDTADMDLRRSVILSIAQQSDSTTVGWLTTIVRDESEHLELRTQALVLSTQLATTDNLAALYTPSLPESLRLQLLGFYSERREETGALDVLGVIAKSDPNRKLRRRAVTAISRSQNPHAADVLQLIVSEP